MNAVVASSISVHRRGSFGLSSCLFPQEIGSFDAEVLSVACDEVTWKEIEPWKAIGWMLLRMCHCKGVDEDG